MAINRIPTWEDSLLEYIDAARRRSGVEAVYLGGASGPDGGTGTPPGGFIGKLSQSQVAYDTTQGSRIQGNSSLVDNLNTIRAELRRHAWWGC